MSTRSNIFVGTAGQDIDATNSGGASGDAFNGRVVAGGSIKYASSPTAHGGAAEFVGSATNGGSYLSWTVPSTETVRCSVYGEGGWPSVETSLLWFGTGSARCFYVARANDGKVRVRNSANTNAGTTTASLPSDGSQWRLELRALRGASAGEVHLAVYLGDSTTPVDSLDLTGIATGAAATDTVRVGLAADTRTLNSTLRLKALRYDDSAATSYIGPVPASAPVVSVATANVALIDATGSTHGSGVSYLITQTDGPTTTPVLRSPGVWTVVRGTSNLTYDVTVTDAVGTATQPVTVTPPPTAPTGPRLVRRRMIDGVLR